MFEVQLLKRVKSGTPRGIALREVIDRHPDLHREYLEAVNV
ncbi:hypothetical protein [uncultured Thiocystis sp.]|jgi:hypothetical protein|nr:hypothetical protein [uncultured Thiocystis sp.]